METGIKKGHFKESVEKRIHSQHMRIEPNISNRSTRIRDISYDQSKKLYRVTIVRNGIRYGSKHFKKLGEAQKYKKQLLEDIKRKIKESQMSQTAIAQLTKNMMVFNVVVLSLGYFNVIPYKWSLILWGSAVFTAIFNEISKQIPDAK